MTKLSWLGVVLSFLLLVVPVRAADATTAAPDPAVAAWQQVISSQIQAFRDHDAATALSFAAASFHDAYADPKDFFIAIINAGYEPIVESKSETFGAYQTVTDGIVLQDVQIVGSDQTLYQAVYEVAKEADGWRVKGVQLGKVPGIGV